jgi:hypothetical protein
VPVPRGEGGRHQLLPHGKCIFFNIKLIVSGVEIEVVVVVVVGGADDEERRGG